MKDFKENMAFLISGMAFVISAWVFLDAHVIDKHSLKATILNRVIHESEDFGVSADLVLINTGNRQLVVLSAKLELIVDRSDHSYSIKSFPSKGPFTLKPGDVKHVHFMEKINRSIIRDEKPIELVISTYDEKGYSIVKRLTVFSSIYSDPKHGYMGGNDELEEEFIELMN